ncbi:MAG: DMT family transporter [Bdellovibrionota bacterium]
MKSAKIEVLDGFLFLVLSLFWAGSFPAIKVIVSEVSPYTGVFLRLGLATALLTVFYKAMRWPMKVSKAQRLRVWIGGLFLQAFPFLLLFWGEQYVSPGLSGVLNGTTPMWTLVLGAIFLRKDEPITVIKLLGLVLGISGLVVVFLPSLTVMGSQFWGVFAVAVMALSYAVGTLINRSVLLRDPGTKLQACLYQQHLASFVFIAFVVVGLMLEGSLAPFWEWKCSAAVLSAIGYLALFSNCIAWGIYFRLLKKWGALRASAVNYLIPALAVGLDFLFYGNVPSATQALGIVMIFGGIVLIQSAAIVAAKGAQKKRASVLTAS